MQQCGVPLRVRYHALPRRGGVRRAHQHLRFRQRFEWTVVSIVTALYRFGSVGDMTPEARSHLIIAIMLTACLIGAWVSYLGADEVIE